MRFFTLKLLIFFEYAVQGAYLTTLGVYLINSLKFTPMEVAAVYSLLGLASLFILPLTGIIADKFLSATRFYIILFLLCSLCLFSLGITADKTVFFVLFALNSLVYIPTLALSNTILLYSLEQANVDKDTNFVAIKVWGTIGFIAAIWLVSFSGLSAANAQFYIAAGAAFCACLTGFLQQKVPVWGDKGQSGLLYSL